MKSEKNNNKNIQDHDSDKSNCVFCKIVSGEIPVLVKLYEDDETMAFMNINPINKGHALVIPKDHVENIYGFSDEIFCRMMITVKKLAVAVKNGADADGVNVVMNNEEAAGQEIFHAHIHIIPRFNDDGLRPWSHKSYENTDEMKLFGERIKSQI